MINGDKKNGSILVGFLVVVILATLIAGLYESYTQKYLPDRSLLSHLHDYGYLTEIPVVYEPGKGIWHPLGWAGSAMMVLMLLYSVRKRVAVFRSWGRLPNWLTAHMFLGIMGPLLVTLHTTFKFGGIITTSYICMIITMVSGLLGRYIYIQIPHSLSGAELEADDIEKMVEELDGALGRFSGEVNVPALFEEIRTTDPQDRKPGPATSLLWMIRTDLINLFKIARLRRILKTRHRLDRTARKTVLDLLKKKAALVRRKNFLSTSQSLLHYWHVFHRPLATVMFAIMFLHIVVYYLFRPAH
jgi:hypothetical protein